MRHPRFLSFLLCSLLLLSVHSPTSAATFTVTTNSDNGASGTLRDALLQAQSDDVINFNNSLGTITIGSGGITTALPILQGVTINGGTGNTISGDNTYPIFFAYSGTNTINNLSLINGLGAGGDGGSGFGGAGGGLGAGGALFVCSSATVNISNINFQNNSVQGGNGGAGGGGNPDGAGGGGLYRSTGADGGNGSGGGGGGGLFNSPGATSAGGGGGLLARSGGIGTASVSGGGGGGGGYYLSTGGAAALAFNNSGGGGGGVNNSAGGNGGGVISSGGGGGGGGGFNQANGGDGSPVDGGGAGGGGGGGNGVGNNGADASSDTGAAAGTGGTGTGGNGNTVNGAAAAGSDGVTAGSFGGGGGGGGSVNTGPTAGNTGNGGAGGGASMGGGGGGGESNVDFTATGGSTGSGGAGGSSNIQGGGGGGGGAEGPAAVANGGAGGNAVLGGGGGGGGTAGNPGTPICGSGGSSTGLGGGGGGGCNDSAFSVVGIGGSGGNAAFGGGGGGGFSFAGTGGSGGTSTFGGGGGSGAEGQGNSAVNGTPGSGGFGGGDAGAAGIGGNGGSAFGGAVFIQTGGALNVTDGGFLSNTLGAAGTGVVSGTAAGSSLYLMTGTTTIFTINVNQTIDGTIAGAGGFTKLGPAVLTLSGDNTYGGTTLISAGGLTFTGSTSGLTGDITDNSLLTFAQSANASYGGQISGTGGVTQNGTAILTLGNSNSYSGTTTVSSGTLRAGAAGAFSSNSAFIMSNTASAILDLNSINQTIVSLTGGGSLGGNVSLGNATLTLSDANGAYDGIISGSSSSGLVKEGTGTFTLSGNNTYGNTTISSGTLTFTGSTSGLTGDIIDNAALIFDQASNSSLAGQISGTGTVRKEGVGTLALLNTSSYTGTTTVSGGTLQAGIVGAFSPNSAVTMENTASAVLDLNDFNQIIPSLAGGGTTGGNVSLGTATLTTGNAANTTYAGNISGSGNLIKQGSGTFSLTGNNAMTGTADVLQGTLNLNGFIAGSVIVENSAILIGDGSIGQNFIVNHGGTLSPGNSIGSISIAGNYTNNGGNYIVEVNGSGQSDQIFVGGTATINGGIVYVSTIDGTFNVNHSYTIVTASSVVGTYSGVISTIFAGNPFLITPVLSYDPQHVYLTIGTTFFRIARTCNQLAVANQIDGITDPSTTQLSLLNTLTQLSVGDAQIALDSLTGQQYAGIPVTTEIVNRQFIRRLYDPIRSIVTTEPEYNDAYSSPCDCCTLPELQLWAEGGGEHSHINGNCNAHSFYVNGYEITLGAQQMLFNDVTIGIAGSYACDHLHYLLGGNSKNKTWLVGVYGLYRPQCYYGLVDLAYGYSNNSLNRPINIGTLEYRAHGKPNVSQFTAYGEIGTDYKYCDVLIQPFAGIEVGAYSRRRTVEQNVGGWELELKRRNRVNAYSRIGLHLTTNTVCQGIHSFNISVDLAWIKRLTSPNNVVNEQFVQFGNNFNIHGTPIGNNSFEGAITLSTKLYNALELYVEGSEEVWNRAYTYNILAGFDWRW